jgi:signal transduction histidine kinase/ActR/RegA family two-component response regulator
VPLRRRLLLLAAAAIVPLALASGLALHALVDEQRAQAQRAGLEIARALSTAVDAELQRSLSVLEAISTATVLDAGDLERFHQLARRVVATGPQWLSIVLHDTQGRMLLNTRLPFGAEMPATAEKETLEVALRTERPLVGYLARGSLGTFNLALRVPVSRNGRLLYVLSGVIRPDAILEVVNRQRLPPDWVVSVFDAKAVRVARSRQHEEFLGEAPAQGLGELMARGQAEGTGLIPTLEGDKVYTAYSRSGNSGWTVAIGIPPSLVDRGAAESLAVFGGGILASLVLGGLAAIVIGRGITAPMKELRAAAQGLGRREPPTLTATPIQEISEVAHALAAAAEERARGEAEREQLLERAQNAHAEAEALASVAAAMSATLEVPRVLQAVAEAVRSVTASDLVRIALPTGADGSLMYRYLTGTRAGGYDQHRIRPGRGFVGRVLQTRRPYRTAEAAADPNVEPQYGLGFVQAEGVRTAMVVPILDGEALHGVIYTARRTPRPFSDADELACERLAGHAAIALRNAVLYTGEQAAREQAEAANRAKDEFLAMLGHELRNPLGAIANAAQLLEHPDTAEYAKGVIRRQINHLSRMTDDLLDAARAMTGKIVLQRRPLDLAEAVANALGAFKAAGRGAQHRVVQHLENAWVDADPTRVEQIASNLLLNAAKYTPAGGTIEVAVRRAGANAELEVSDDGIGMPRELLESVFEAFVQGERSLDRSQGGLGIGLTLVQRLAQLHGGSASAHSEGPGKGSRFTVRLPLAEPPVARSAEATVPAGESRDILIVEDNPDARETLRQLLELEGHRVRVAADGAAALAAMRAAPPQAALIDIGLPEMDGYELARRIRAELDGTTRPVLIAITGYGLPEDRERALAAGFDAHLVKPIELPTLQAALEALGEH